MTAEWGGYGAIVREARALDDQQRRRGLVDCPVCGTPLQVSDGVGNCPMGYWRGRIDGTL